MKVFGEKREGVTYLPRTCVYGVAIDGSGRVLMVSARGRIGLPGGGIDPGETPKQALVRETMEETGYTADAGEPVGEARQLVTRVAQDKYRDKTCVFHRMTVTGEPVEPTAVEHHALWMTPADAVRQTAYGSHAWAIERAISE